MNFKKPLSLSFLFLFPLVFTVVYVKYATTNIAYVRNLELVYGYNGMKQAHDEFNAQKKSWQSNIDTLKQRYQQSYLYYQQNLKTFSDAEKRDQIDLLTRMDEDIKKYSKAIQDEALEQESNMTQEVLSQINSFVEEYAKKHDYDIVLGADGSGSVIYGNKGQDITEEVLKELNKTYKVVPTNVKLK